MIINSENLNGLYTGFNGSFKKGFGGAETAYAKVAMTVPSTGKATDYGWLGQFPKLREWIGPRHVKNLSLSSFTIKNRSFEQTIGVPRDDIADDQYGIFGPMFEEMGRAAAELPDELVFGLLRNGWAQNCYDGQFFFDTDHPVLSGGNMTTVANTDGGAGTPWFLLDTSRALKPVIYQERATFGTLVKKDQPGDDNVFFDKEFIYGSDGRANAGFGLWQLAWGSMQTLDAAHYETARNALQNMVGDEGRLLGIRPTLLVVPPSLEGAARALLTSELAAGGETNKWKGTAELLVTPWVSPLINSYWP